MIITKLTEGELSAIRRNLWSEQPCRDADVLLSRCNALLDHITALSVEQNRLEKRLAAADRVANAELEFNDVAEARTRTDDANDNPKESQRLFNLLAEKLRVKTEAKKAYRKAKGQ